MTAGDVKVTANDDGMDIFDDAAPAKGEVEQAAPAEETVSREPAVAEPERVEAAAPPAPAEPPKKPKRVFGAGLLDNAQPAKPAERPVDRAMKPEPAAEKPPAAPPAEKATGVEVPVPQVSPPEAKQDAPASQPPAAAKATDHDADDRAQEAADRLDER